MNIGQVMLVIACALGVGIFVGVVPEGSRKQPTPTPVTAPTQCTLKIGNVLVQGEAYHD